MMMRTPKVNEDQIEALRMLLRIDFSRAVGVVLRKSSSPTLQTVEILELTDLLSSVEQPLLIAKAMMFFSKEPSAHLALDQPRYELLGNLLNTQLKVEDFPGADSSKVELFLSPLRANIDSLKEQFESAGFLDSDTMKDGPGPTNMRVKPSNLN